MFDRQPVFGLVLIFELQRMKRRTEQTGAVSSLIFYYLWLYLDSIVPTLSLRLSGVI